jgi:hypothetical protein
VTAVIANSKTSSLPPHRNHSLLGILTRIPPAWNILRRNAAPSGAGKGFDLPEEISKSLQPSGSATAAEILYRLLSSNAQLATHLAASISISAFL